MNLRRLRKKPVLQHLLNMRIVLICVSLHFIIKYLAINIKFKGNLCESLHYRKINASWILECIINENEIYDLDDLC